MIPINPAIDNSHVASPCVRHCCLDSEDLCIGCGRYLAEITSWMQLSPDQKKSVINDAKQRLERLRMCRE
jgi:uncharacterized protein